MEDVCKQLRRLYVVKNFSLEHSVSITCDPSFSASNEIHVCIVSSSSHSQSAICLSGSINAYSKKKKPSPLINGLQHAFLAALRNALMEWMDVVDLGLVASCQPSTAGEH